MKKEEIEKRDYHRWEAKRIQNELNNLGSEFAKDGIVRTVLRNRIEQEKRRSTGAEDEKRCNCNNRS